MLLLSGNAVAGELSVIQIFLRMLCAMLVGLVIGTEREYTKRPAGMRTHILVAIGSCGVMITGQLLFFQYNAYGATPDPARLPAQVITGVGFLGAGTILRQGANVKGLTTAASLWAVACFGIAAGAGYYTVALLGMIFVLLTLTVFEILQARLVGAESSLRSCIVHTTDITAGLEALNRCATAHAGALQELSTAKAPDGGYTISFRIDIGGFHSRSRREAFLTELAAAPAITSLQLLRSDGTESNLVN